MKKLSFLKSDRVLIGFIIKAVLSSILCILLLSYLSSLVIFKLDMSLDTAKTAGVIICLLSAIITAMLSVSKLKNNGFLMGVISTLPIIFYSLINAIFSGSGVIYFLIKLAVIVVSGGVTGLLTAERSRKFRVK